MLDALDLHEGDTIVEIGSGHGVLTLPLVERCAEKKCRVVAVEKDATLTQEVRSKIQELGLQEVVEVVHGDVLAVLTSYILPLTSYKLAGNLPYYISGALLRLISELETKPRVCVFMLQREVGERLAAKPPRMNLLAAATQIWAEPKILQFLKPTDFSPPPKVESAVVTLATRILPLATSEELKLYYSFIKKLFKQPRKTILNNIADGFELPKEKVLKILAERGFTGRERPQQMDIATLLTLSRCF